MRLSIVHVPPAPSLDHALPLVVDMHGSGSTAAQQVLFSGMNTTADIDGFVVVYPQAIVKSGSGFVWNIPGVPLIGGSPVPAGAADDIAFIKAVVAKLHATCGIIDLELLSSAPSKKFYVQLAEALQGLPRVAVDDRVFDRALEVQAQLAAMSQHRAVPLPDLLVAACAEANQLVVLHYDAGFDRIAKITRQPTQWVVPRGSVA